jgi:hypothetical protein
MSTLFAFSATMSFACFFVATNKIFLPELAIFSNAAALSSIYAAVLYKSMMFTPLRSV